jgi:hypothetical protein
MSTALLAESRELLGLVALAALASQVGMRITSRPRLGTLAADNPKSLLRKVRAGKVVREMSGREDQGAIFKRKH